QRRSARARPCCAGAVSAAGPQTGRAPRGGSSGDADEVRQRLLQCVREDVDLVHVVVDVETGPRRGTDAQGLAEGLGAVLAGPYRHAGYVEGGGDVVCVYTVHHEADESDPTLGRAKDPDAFHAAQACDGPLYQGLV